MRSTAILSIGLAAVAAAFCAPGAVGSARSEPERDGELTVRVRSSERGEAVVGAQVEVFTADAARGSAISDTGGLATIRSLPDGPRHVRVTASGLATTFRVVPPASRELAVTLGPGHTLTGAVEIDAAAATDDAGAPADSAPSVVAGPVASGDDERWCFARANVGGDGRFRLAGLPRGPVELWLLRAGQEPASLGSVSVPGVSTVPVTRVASARPSPRRPETRSAAGLRDEIHGEVEVRVVDAADRPVSGATVWIADGFADRALGAVRVVTGRDGRTSLPALGSGVATAVGVSADGHADSIVAGSRFDAAVAGRSSLVIRLDRRTAVRVSAVDAVTGKPVPGAVVWAIGGPPPGSAGDDDAPPRWNGGVRDAVCAFTDDAGVAAVVGMPVAGARLQLEATGYRFTRVWVPGDAVRSTVSMQPSLDVGGRAVRQGGEPVAGAWIWLYRQDAPPGVVSALGPAKSDASGAFRFADVPEGSWVVATDAADSPDIASFAMGPVTPGQMDLRLELRERRTVRGLVRDEVGSPVAGAAVICDASGTADLRGDTPRTGPDGRFTSRDAPWGAFASLVVADRVGPGGRQRRVLRAPRSDPGTADLVLDLRGGATIRGILVDSNDVPCPNVPIIAIDAGHADASVAYGRTALWNGCVTDSGGEFEIGGLVPAVRHRLWLVWDWRDTPTSGGQAPSWLNKEISPPIGTLPGPHLVRFRIPGR